MSRLSDARVGSIQQTASAGRTLKASLLLFGSARYRKSELESGVPEGRFTWTGVVRRQYAGSWYVGSWHTPADPISWTIAPDHGADFPDYFGGPDEPLAFFDSLVEWAEVLHFRQQLYARTEGSTPSACFSGRSTDLSHSLLVQPAALPAPHSEEGARPRTVERSIVNRLRDHLAYLENVSTQGAHPPITRETASQARQAWWDVCDAAGITLPIPAACTGPDGKMFYSWDRGKHHLELEIIPGQPAEFFYRDRETGYLWGEDYTVGDPLPAEAVQKLKLFI